MTDTPLTYKDCPTPGAPPHEWHPCEIEISELTHRSMTTGAALGFVVVASVSGSFVLTALAATLSVGSGLRLHKARLSAKKSLRAIEAWHACRRELTLLSGWTSACTGGLAMSFATSFQEQMLITVPSFAASFGLGAIAHGRAKKLGYRMRVLREAKSSGPLSPQ